MGGAILHFRIIWKGVHLHICSEGGITVRGVRGCIRCVEGGVFIKVVGSCMCCLNVEKSHVEYGGSHLPVGGRVWSVDEAVGAMAGGYLESRGLVEVVKGVRGVTGTGKTVRGCG